jgi:hypothetical protein
MHRTCHERHTRAARGRRSSDGEAHLARGAVRQKTHRVEVLDRWARRHDDVAPREIMGRYKHRRERLDDGLGLTHATKALLAARDLPMHRPEKNHAARAQRPLGASELIGDLKGSIKHSVDALPDNLRGPVESIRGGLGTVLDKTGEGVKEGIGGAIDSLFGDKKKNGK